MANPRFAWGIDVGNRALKAIKLVRDGSTGGMRVDDCDVIEHEHILSDAGDNKEALITQALNAFSQKHPEKGGAVAIGASGQSSFARFIKLPPVEEKKIPEIVRFEAIQQIPFPLDDVEWAYQLFRDEKSPDVEVGIFAMRKELVQSHIKQFTDAGLNVQVVQMSPLAVYNAMYYDQRIKGTTMIVDVGAENTDLIITEGEQVWLRSIPVGGNNFTEALIKQFKLKFPKAEELKRNAATSKYTRQILQAMRPVFDSLVAEIQRSIGFYASVHRNARISRVVALGGTFRLPGLMKFLQMQLQLDVQRFDALGATPPSDARIATLLNDNVLSTVGAYGLALQAMGEGKISSSLLPLAIRRERMWREKTKWFGAAAALFVLGTSVSLGRVYYDRMQHDAAEPVRREIAAQLQTAQQLDTDWKAVEASGAPERTQIASLQSLTHLRELQAKLLAAIDAALPEPTAKPKDKRAERRVVQLNETTEAYYEDLSPAVTRTVSGEFFTMSAPEFIQNAAVPGSQAAGYGQRGAKMLIGTGLGVPGAVPAAPAVEGDPSAAAVVPAGKQRGFLITMVCTTPKARWSDLAEQIRDALIEQTKPAAGSTEKQAFRIERVEIVSGRKLLPAELVPAIHARNANAGGFSRRPLPNQPYRARGPGGAGMFRPGGMNEMEEGGGRPMYRPRPPVATGGAFRGGRPAIGANGLPVRPGASLDDPAATEELDYPMPSINFDNPLNEAPIGTDPNAPIPYLDPVTGEDATNDNRLTFLIAVILDAAPPAPPPAPAAPAEGSQTPAAQSASAH